MMQSKKLVECKFKDRQLKKLNKKLKELEDKLEKLTGQTTE